jgi:hypothetical protein
MGSHDSGFKSCLSTVGAIVGIAAGLVSVIRFFFPDSESFLQAFSDLLRNIVPVVSEGLSSLGESINIYVEEHPSTTWISAVIIILLAGAVSFWFEEDITFDSPLQNLLALSPLAFIWIWLFSGFASTFGIIMFVIGFIIAVFAVPLLDLIG